MNTDVLTVTLNPSIDRTVYLTELIPYELNRAARTQIDPGGKGINVARVLQNFGVPVLATGLIAGEQGRLLLRHLDDLGVETDFLQVSGETRTNLKLFDLSNQKITEINEHGCPVDEKDLTSFVQKFNQLLPPCEIVVLSGSTPPGIPDNFYYECIEDAKKAHKKVILDADGEAFRLGLKAVPYAVKPNLHELEHLTGRSLTRPEEIVEVIKDLLATGISLVMVSMGKNGAFIADHKTILYAKTWDVTACGATGAGDSMVGATAYALLQGLGLTELAKFAVAAGTVTACKTGTRICEFDEVSRSLGLVTIETQA